MLHVFLTILTCACFTYQALAGLIVHDETPGVQSNSQYLSRAWEPTRNASNATVASRPTSADIDNARKIVKDAIAKITILNKARLDNSRRNQYRLSPETQLTK
jgi:hypothetical protein